MERHHEGAGPETTGNETEQREGLHQFRPRIYVADLAAYNDGQLHGVWADADQEPEVLHEQVAAMLAASPTGHAEEFAIHEFEGFGDYRVDEYASLESVSRIARGIREHGLAFAAWAARCTDGNAIERFEDAFLGDHESVAAYAAEFIDAIGLEEQLDQQVPDGLRPYVTIDLEALARDLVLGGDITAVEHERGVWIFDGML